MRNGRNSVLFRWFSLKKYLYMSKITKSNHDSFASIHVGALTLQMCCNMMGILLGILMGLLMGILMGALTCWK